MRAFVFATLAFLAFLTPARAEQTPVVVELFTSQGCSSCPPADAHFAELAVRDDVIALAYHIDYWDYLGWHDRFSAPEFSARQKAYAMAVHEEGVYTPQIIVNGHARVVGSRAPHVTQAISAAQELPLDLQVQPAEGGHQLRVLAQPALAAQHVQVMHVLPGATDQIDGGENAGHAIHYANIVTGIDDVGLWQPGADLQLRIPAPETGYLVVVIQDQGHGLIRGAVTLR